MQSVKPSLHAELDELEHKAAHYQVLNTNDQLSEQQKRLAAIQERIETLRKRLDSDT